MDMDGWIWMGAIIKKKIQENEGAVSSRVAFCHDLLRLASSSFGVKKNRDF
jgi:bifunctional DNase/RNase